jgi:hypothetical protein
MIRTTQNIDPAERDPEVSIEGFSFYLDFLPGNQSIT